MDGWLAVTPTFAATATCFASPRRATMNVKRPRWRDGPGISRYRSRVDFKPFETIAFVALRILSGLMFACHGAQKILGVLTTRPGPDIGSQMWFGGMIELIGGIAIALGLLTRPFAILASGTMSVAYIQFHWKGAFDEKFFPVSNGGELALLYCFLFLYIALRKDNPVAIDRLFWRSF